MSKYLARLKTEKQSPRELPKLPKGQNSQTYVLPKLPKPPFDSKDSTEGERFLEIQEGSPPDLQRMVGEALAEVDRLGRPWPTRFMLDLPGDDRQRLRELEGQIDAAVIGNDAESLQGLLTDWRRLLLSKLN